MSENQKLFWMDMVRDMMVECERKGIRYEKIAATASVSYGTVRNFFAGNSDSALVLAALILLLDDYTWCDRLIFTLKAMASVA